MAIRAVLLGPPASGKGTQGRRLATSTGVAYLSTGALLREAVENGTELGLQAKPILDRGGYLPDDLMCRILGEWLERHPEGWVLDGFPRSIPQAEYLDAWLAERQLALTAAIALDVPLDELLRRIQERVECPACRWSGQVSQTTANQCPECGSVVSKRDDDEEENFLRRHQAYSTYTVPLIGYYDARNVLRHVDATASVDDVANLVTGLFTPPVAD
jgi:adenylate kinase